MAKKVHFIPTGPPTTLGESIRAARQMRDMTQDEVADALGVKHQSLSMWEHDKVRPGGLNMAKLRALFGSDLLAPVAPPSVASLAYWQSRAARVEQLAVELLEAQRAIVEEMGRQIAPETDTITDRVGHQHATLPGAVAARPAATAAGSARPRKR